MTRSGLVIAIDGPGGSGKSTVSRALASRLGLAHLDTGAMYRVVTLEALRRNIPLDGDVALAELADGLEMSLDSRVLVEGRDVTEAIRSDEVNAAVSLVAAVPSVRKSMVARQRAWVDEHDGGVVEGRDIASVVLPDADVRVFLTASEEVRASRRAKEEMAAPDSRSVAATRASIAARDAIDSTRSTAPLLVTEGAVTIDSTARSIDEVVEAIVDLAIRSRRA